MTATGTGTGPQPTLTPDMAAGAPSPRWPARWLDRALRVVAAGPRPFYRAAVVSLGVTSLLAAAVAEVTKPHGPLPASQRHMIDAAVAALCVSAVLGLASLVAGRRMRPPAWLDRVLAPRERAAVWLAVAAWLPFLLLIVYYRAKATFPPPAKYLYSPFDDKRYDTAEFLLGVLAPVLFLVTAARVLAIGRERPATWRAWLAGCSPAPSRRTRLRRPRGTPPAKRSTDASAGGCCGWRRAWRPRPAWRGTSSGRRGTCRTRARRSPSKRKCG